MRYLIDSSAWIDYLDGNKKGEALNKIFKENNEIFTTVLNIGEVISKTKRNNKNHETAYSAIVNNAKIIEITAKIAKEAGVLHAELKAKWDSFSLADAIIISSAKEISAKIITSDEHFKLINNILLLK